MAAASAERRYGPLRRTRGLRGSGWRYSRGGGGRVPGPRLKAMSSTPPSRQPIRFLLIASSQEVICVGMRRSPGNGVVVMIYLVEKGIDAGNCAHVRHWSDRAGSE